MRATPSSDLRSGCELTAISEDKDWVYIEYLDMSGTQRRLRSRFLVAADGKTGFVRKHYLEPKGIDLLWVEKYGHIRSRPKTKLTAAGSKDKIQRDLGCHELEDNTSNTRDPSDFSALESRVLAR